MFPEKFLSHHILPSAPSHSSIRGKSPDMSQRQSPAPPSTSAMSGPIFASQGGYALGDNYRGYHAFIPTYQFHSPPLNPMEFHNSTMEPVTNVNHGPLATVDSSDRAPWAVESLLFRATSQANPPPLTRDHRYYRRQPKARNVHQELQTKIQNSDKEIRRRNREHSNKEKRRRDQIAVFTDIERIMQYALPWAGEMCTPPCKVKMCSSRTARQPKQNSNCRNKKGAATTGASYQARNNKDDPKTDVLLYADLWKFSFTVHFQPDQVPLIIHKIEKLVDQKIEKRINESLHNNDKDMNQKNDEKTRGKVERDIAGKTAYKVLEDLLVECSAHGIELDDGIAARQEARRIRGGIDAVGEGEGEDCWRERRGTLSSSRTFSQYEEEGNDAEERGGERRCSMMSEAGHLSDEG